MGLPVITFCVPIEGQIEVMFQWRPQLRDVNDEMVLETATNGRADALITYNIRDFLPAAGRFGLRVLRPGELLKEIRS
jgi:predicted nucleic acid-binding protein